MTMSRGVQRTQIVCTFVLPSKTQLSDMRILLWRKTNPVKSSRICCSCIGWLLAEDLCAFMLSFPGGYVHFVNYSFWSITGFFQKKKRWLCYAMEIILASLSRPVVSSPPSHMSIQWCSWYSTESSLEVGIDLVRMNSNGFCPQRLIQQKSGSYK